MTVVAALQQATSGSWRCFAGNRGQQGGHTHSTHTPAAYHYPLHHPLAPHLPRACPACLLRLRIYLSPPRLSFTGSMAA